MTPCLLASITAEAPNLQERVAGIESAVTMDELVGAVARLTRELGVLVLETVLAQRAAEPTNWPACPQCSRRHRSKGWKPREIVTSLGRVCWRRRVGRCPGGCRGSTSAPLDEAQGLASHQRHTAELKQKATLLAVFVPMATASAIMERLTCVRVCASTIWHWVQAAGQQATAQLEAELARVADGAEVTREAMEDMIDQLLMLIGADGVMVPFRPNGSSPKGGIVWREVKVGIIARLERRVNRAGNEVTRLRQRRLVAVLGDIDALARRLELEARRQGLATAARAVWISDGARGLWRIFRDNFAAKGVVGVLDFYHTAGQLWTAAETWYCQWMPSAHLWLEQSRHTLRLGEVGDLIDLIRGAANDCYRPEGHRPILDRVANYLDRHRLHLDYPTFKAAGFPLGSGFVESAVKWLIQQRFKGVGMRWSEDGFNNLLMLRLAWANDRYDELFQPSPNS